MLPLPDAVKTLAGFDGGFLEGVPDVEVADFKLFFEDPLAWQEKYNIIPDAEAVRKCYAKEKGLVSPSKQ